MSGRDLLGDSQRGGLTDEQALLVSDCRKRSHKLSDSERNFLTTCEAQGFALTSQQDALLNEIWDRVT